MKKEEPAEKKVRNTTEICKSIAGQMDKFVYLMIKS